MDLQLFHKGEAMRSTIRRFVYVMTKVLPKKSIRQQVYKRVLSGKCLVGFINPTKDVPVCDCDSETRGVCHKHYQAFLTVLSSIAENSGQEAAESHAAEQYREGVILDIGVIRDVRSTNPFAQVAS